MTRKTTPLSKIPPKDVKIATERLGTPHITMKRFNASL